MTSLCRSRKSFSKEPGIILPSQKKTLWELATDYVIKNPQDISLDWKVFAPENEDERGEWQEEKNGRKLFDSLGKKDRAKFKVREE